ncbi:MAG: P1 family peptidase [Clostridia bacterium]|nr:P1 family peptidase [Clostridia bacterium]
MQKGKRNLISDVPGVLVGHCTLSGGDVQTGVTAILPHSGDIYHEKCPAASHIINGYGKSTGLVQIDELGNIETPLILTNTLGVGDAFAACVRYMTERNPGIGRDEGTVNPVILECNDSFLNDIRGMHVKQEYVFKALEDVSDEFELGAVGAGRGMTCYGLKGGIGSASRILEAAGREYTLGALVLTNFGALQDLTVYGQYIGRKLAGVEDEPKGSCIMVIATDAPVSPRQLHRIAKRAQSGLARTGGITSGGSGEIVVAFSTANRMKTAKPVWHPSLLNDDLLTPLFRAAIETVEESIIRSMLEAETVTGRDGNKRVSLAEMIKGI